MDISIMEWHVSIIEFIFQMERIIFRDDGKAEKETARSAQGKP